VTRDQHAARARRLPAFLDEWRHVNGVHFTPIDYLNQQAAVPFVIATGWLFAPDFLEYRGGVFRGELPRGLTRQDQDTIDKWFERLDGDVAQVERIANQLTLYDTFAACDLASYENDLPTLAHTIARSWRGLLQAEFPDRSFKVEVVDDHQSYGPQVTFSHTS
jgi:hypothetical protein